MSQPSMPTSPEPAAPRRQTGPQTPRPASGPKPANGPGFSLPSPRINLLLWQADPALRFQWLVIAMVTFLITMVLLGLSATNSALRSASGQIRAEITIQVPTTDAGFRADGADPTLRAVNDVLNQVDWIEDFRLLSVDEVRDILRPWVGDDVELQGLPVPYVIAASRNRRNAGGGRTDQLDMIGLKGALDRINPHIVVDDHAQTLRDIQGIATSAAWGLALSTILTLCLLTAIAVIAVNAALRIQRQVLDVLFLAGASDPFIARQFVLFACSLAVRGLVTGVIGGGLCYLATINLFQLGPAQPGVFWGVSWMQIGTVSAVSLLSLVGVGIVTHAVVIRRLRQIY